MEVIEKVKKTFWTDVARNCSYATFFHTPHYSELMTNTFPFRDITKGFIFDDGTRVVFPFLQRKKNIFRGFLSDYVSGLLYVYGGPIADKELSDQKLDEIFEYINSTFVKYDNILIRGNSFIQNITPRGFQEIKDFSHVAELFKCDSEEDLFMSYSKRYRSYVRKAQKSGTLVVKEASTLDEYERLYKLYQQTIQYWDRILTDYPFKLFQNIYYLKCQDIKLWTVYYENNMIGGDVTLYWNDNCCMWLSYHDREYSKLQQRRYMLHNVFLDCKEKGIKYYDFLQSGGIKGLEEFKESMGGKVYPHSAWLKENDFLKKIRGIKRNMASFLKREQ